MWGNPFRAGYVYGSLKSHFGFLQSHNAVLEVVNPFCGRVHGTCHRSPAAAALNPDFLATSMACSLNFTPTLIHSKNTTASSGVVPNLSAKLCADTFFSLSVDVINSLISVAFSSLSKPYFLMIRSNSPLCNVYWSAWWWSLQIVFLWTFQSCFWCSTVQYQVLWHREHFLVAGFPQTAQAPCPLVVVPADDSDVLLSSSMLWF